MAESASGRDEENPVLWLATREGKMDLLFPLGISRVEKSSLFGHIINLLFAELVATRRLNAGLVIFCIFIDLDFVLVNMIPQESLYVSGKLHTYPSPKPTLSLTSHLRQNVTLGEGWVGTFPVTYNDSKNLGQYPYTSDWKNVVAWKV